LGRIGKIHELPSKGVYVITSENSKEDGECSQALDQRRRLHFSGCRIQVNESENPEQCKVCSNRYFKNKRRKT
jgi:hypothetical protein